MFSRLEVLALQGNQLVIIDPVHLAKHGPRLKKLWLHDNNLEMVADLTQLKTGGRKTDEEEHIWLVGLNSVENVLSH